MEPRVIILNGPPGAGKSTVGRSLAATQDKGICIHGDQLSEAGDCAIGANLATKFIAGDYQLVVFEHCFTRPQSLKEFQDNYLGAAPVFFYTLWAQLENIRQRDELRDSKEPLADNLVSLYQEMSEDLPGLAPIVYVDLLSVSGATELILARSNAGHGRLLSTSNPDSQLPLSKV